MRLKVPSNWRETSTPSPLSGYKLLSFTNAALVTHRLGNVGDKGLVCIKTAARPCPDGGDLAQGRQGLTLRQDPPPAPLLPHPIPPLQHQHLSRSWCHSASHRLSSCSIPRVRLEETKQRSQTQLCASTHLTLSSTRAQQSWQGMKR